MRDVKQEHSSVISLNWLFPVFSTPPSSLHTQNFHPLPKLLGQKRSHWVKCLFHVEQVSPYFILYKRAVYFLWDCDSAQGHFWWLASWLWKMPQAVLSWAPISGRERLKDELLAWHRWLTCPAGGCWRWSLNAPFAPALGFGKCMSPSV